MKITDSRSLLPRLNPLNNNSCLKISLISEDPCVLERVSFPFQSVTDSDPFGRLIEAQFLTDAGSSLKKVFILVQRDRYLLARDALKPLSNAEIDTYWKRAFAFYSRQQEGGSFVAFSDQTDEGGELNPYRSLFFCKAKQIFFHPPCPRCGCFLEQCCDDEMLASFGLHPYSCSLERYLVCPACACSGSPDFYTYEIEGLGSARLKNRQALIKEFDLLLKNGLGSAEFPCAQCPDRNECYGSGLAHSRICSLSFYPFYILLFESMPLHAADFLSLASGASFQEIKTELQAKQELGRIKCLEVLEKQSNGVIPSLFGGIERHFGEVLYLKLSFLGELIQSVLAGEEFCKDPDMKLSLDQVWVKIADHGSLLPFLWTLKVSSISLGVSSIETSKGFPGTSEIEGLQFLGRVWFYALLVNGRQNITSIYAVLCKLSKEPGGFSEVHFEHTSDPCLYPENIFWNPDGKSVGKNWHSLWDRALGLGWSLVASGLKKEAPWSRKALTQQLEVLRAEVKDHLFRQELEEESLAVPAAPAEDGAIYQILKGIVEKWRTESEEEKVPPEPEKEDAETVILSLEKETPAPPPSQPGPFEEEMPETVIFSPGMAARGGERPVVPPPAEPIMKTKGEEEKKKEKTEGPAEDLFEDGLLAETIILRPEDIRDKGKDGGKD